MGSTGWKNILAEIRQIIYEVDYTKKENDIWNMHLHASVIEYNTVNFGLFKQFSLFIRSFSPF